MKIASLLLCLSRLGHLNAIPVIYLLSRVCPFLSCASGHDLQRMLKLVLIGLKNNNTQSKVTAILVV